MDFPNPPQLSASDLPSVPSEAAAIVSASGDALETQLREIITEGVHSSASLAWLIKGPAAIALLQGRDEMSTGANMLVTEAAISGLTTRQLAEEVGRRYQRFISLEPVLTGYRRRITLALPVIVSDASLSAEEQIALMVETFNQTVLEMWNALADGIMP